MEVSLLAANSEKFLEANLLSKFLGGKVNYLFLSEASTNSIKADTKSERGSRCRLNMGEIHGSWWNSMEVGGGHRELSIVEANGIPWELVCGSMYRKPVDSYGAK